MDLESGRLFEAGHLLNFHHFQQVKYVYFATNNYVHPDDQTPPTCKTINANKKTRRSNKARFLWNTLKKSLSSGISYIRIYSIKWVGWGWALTWVWLGGGGGGRLFEAGRLLTFTAFRMGAYSRWAVIRGWALIRINTGIFISETFQYFHVSIPQAYCYGRN